MNSVSQATDRLYDLVRRQGPDILKLPSSVKAYLNQELAEFPEEKAVLLASVDAGILDQIRNPPQSDEQSIETFYRVVATRFSKSAGVHPEWSKWAVNLWRDVYSETPRSSKPKPVNFGKTLRELNAEINNPENKDPQLDLLRTGTPMWMKIVMTFIVVCGAFSGGFIGRSWPIAAIVFGWDVVDMTMGKSEFEKLFPDNKKKMTVIQKAIAYTVFFLVFSTPAAISAALGAMAGWCFGGADGRPWLGFSVCFTAACGANTIMVMIAGCIPVLIVTFIVSFTAGFKTASTTT